MRICLRSLNRRKLDIGVSWPILKLLVYSTAQSTGLPVTWQCWLWLIELFALEIVVTRELRGVARMIAFLAVALGLSLAQEIFNVPCRPFLSDRQHPHA
jgi:hypothetical protein